MKFMRIQDSDVSYRDQYDDFDYQYKYELQDFCKEILDAYLEENEHVTEEGYLDNIQYFIFEDKEEFEEAMQRVSAQEGLGVIYRDALPVAKNIWKEWWRNLPY